MTDADLTIRDTEGNVAAIVTITSLGTDAGDELARQAREAIEQQFAEGRVSGQ